AAHRLHHDRAHAGDDVAADFVAQVSARAVACRPDFQRHGRTRHMDAKLIDAARAAFPASKGAVTLGAPMKGTECHAEPLVTLPLAMMNRHGLIAGATGTGKTKTLQLLAEQLSNAGVPVFVADMKGDVS